jgi:hypothetical protein
MKALYNAFNHVEFAHDLHPQVSSTSTSVRSGRISSLQSVNTLKTWYITHAQTLKQP